MPNQINRDIYVLSSKVKDPIDYVRLTNDIPIVFTFRDYDILPGSAAQVYVQKPSGKAVYDTAAISGNVVTVTVRDQMFAELGVSDLQIRITQGDEKLVSFSQPVRVHPNYTDGDAQQSQNEGGFFDDAEQAVENANQAAGLANQAAQAANEAAEAVREAVSGVINDDQASTLTTYSSSKIDEKLQQQTQESVIDDSTTSDTKTFSSQKISNLIGALSSLTTEQRSNIVSAINELVERINNQDTDIDDFDQRLSNEKNQVDFITDTIIGDRGNLDTTDKSSIVGAINEVNGKLMTGSYTIPRPSGYDMQTITITTGKDMRNAYIAVACMDNLQTDAPQFLITGRTQTGFSFIFIPSGTSRPYVCQWIAVF